VELYSLGGEEAVRMGTGQKPREAGQHGRCTESPLGAFDDLAPRSLLSVVSLSTDTHAQFPYALVRPIYFWMSPSQTGR